MKKVKTGTMLHSSTIKLADDYRKKANVLSRNEFIEKSIHFYSSFLDKDENISYLNKTIDRTLSDKINLLEMQIASIFFKMTIELNVISTLLASTTYIDTETLKRIRVESINEVKQTSGKIDLEEIFRTYSMKEGD